MQTAAKAPHIDDAALIKKAARNAATQAGLSMRELAAIIGCRRETLSRSTAELSGKQAELALLFLRSQRSLSALTGGSRSHIRHWMRTRNLHLGDQVPKTLMQSVDGLVRSVTYRDAMRGKL